MLSLYTAKLFLNHIYITPCNFLERKSARLSISLRLTRPIQEKPTPPFTASMPVTVLTVAPAVKVRLGADMSKKI